MKQDRRPGPCSLIARFQRLFRGLDRGSGYALMAIAAPSAEEQQL